MGRCSVVSRNRAPCSSGSKPSGQGVFRLKTTAVHGLFLGRIHDFRPHGRQDRSRGAVTVILFQRRPLGGREVGRSRDCHDETDPFEGPTGPTVAWNPKSPGFAPTGASRAGLFRMDDRGFLERLREVNLESVCQ